MQQTSLLDFAEWRAFRLFLTDLDDGDLARIGSQLRRELATSGEPSCMKLGSCAQTANIAECCTIAS